MSVDGVQTPVPERDLDALREMILNLQRDVTKQEGDIVEMKSAIAACKTNDQADRQFGQLSTPDQVEQKFDSIKRQLLVAIEAKASRSELNAALSKKATVDDLQRLGQDLDALTDRIRQQTTNGDTLHLMMAPIETAPMSPSSNRCPTVNGTDMARVDLLGEQLTVLESAFDEFVVGADPKALKKAPGAGSRSAPASGPARQVHEMSERIAAFDGVLSDLDAKYRALSDWASAYPDQLADCAQRLASAQQEMAAIEQTIRVTAMDPERIYLEVHPRVQEIAEQTAKALQMMEDESRNSLMLNASDVAGQLERLRQDLGQVKVGLLDQVASISDILARLNKDEALSGKKLAVWQDGVITTLNHVKSIAESNQKGLDDMQKPIADQLNSLQAENKMFFKELLRMEGQHEELILQIKKYAAGKQSSLHTHWQ